MKIILCPLCKNDGVLKQWCDKCKGAGEVQAGCPNYPSPCFCDGSCNGVRDPGGAYTTGNTGADPA